MPRTPEAVQVLKSLTLLLERVRVVRGHILETDASALADDLVALIDSRIANARATAAVFGIWCTPVRPPGPGSEHVWHAGWYGEDAGGNDPTLFNSACTAADELVDAPSDHSWTYDVRPYAAIPCPVCVAEITADAKQGAAVAAPISTRDDLECEPTLAKKDGETS